MALGDDYVTPDELAAEFRIGDGDDYAELSLSISAATAMVTAHCGRDFNAAAEVSARIFRPETANLVRVDDISTSTGLIVKTDQGDDGTYETTWTATDYQLEPMNGAANGLTGWPYTRIRSIETRWFPTARRGLVQVTATWGWPAIPSPVKKATMILAARLYKRRDSADGVLGGFDLGPVRIGTRLDPDVEMLLAPYRKHPVLVA